MNLSIMVYLLRLMRAGGFLLFKQKTAYEMRISDWSSDVCSSDLGLRHAPRPAPQGRGSSLRARPGSVPPICGLRRACRPASLAGRLFDLHAFDLSGSRDASDIARGGKRPATRLEPVADLRRSEARPAGKECVSPCRSRGLPVR